MPGEAAPPEVDLTALFSFHKGGRTLQDRDLHPEVCIPAARQGDSGLYCCKVVPEDGSVQKQSHQLEIRVWGKWEREGNTLWEYGEGSLKEEPGAWMPQLTSYPGCCPSSSVLSSVHPEPQAPQPHCGGHGRAPL